MDLVLALPLLVAAAFVVSVLIWVGGTLLQAMELQQITGTYAKIAALDGSMDPATGQPVLQEFADAMAQVVQGSLVQMNEGSTVAPSSLAAGNLYVNIATDSTAGQVTILAEYGFPVPLVGGVVPWSASYTFPDETQSPGT